jgi:endogenous inhibitor of DNA gyrase (YacG/DUF329 family)
MKKRKCLYCKNIFHRSLSPSNIKNGKGRYCSRSCSCAAWKEKYKNGEIKANLKGLEIGRTMQKGRKASEETRRKISLSLIGSKRHIKPHSQETKNKLKIISKNRWKNNGYKKKMLEVLSIERKKRIEKAEKSKINIICLGCGKEFIYWNRASVKRLFCSTRCSNSYSLKKRWKDEIYLEKMRALHRGINNFNWKGGITPLNQKIRTSYEYGQWRKQVFKRDNYTCDICGDHGGYLHADHIKPFSLFPELRFDINNGRTLCKKCHEKTDTYAGRCYRYVC